MRVNAKNVIIALLIIAAYVISGKASLMLALPPGYSSPIFLPSGIAIACVFTMGRSALLPVLLGSLLLNLWAGYSSHHVIAALDFASAAVIAVASLLQAVLGGWMLRSTIGYPAAFDQTRQVLRFLFLVPIICLVSASLSVFLLGEIGTFSPDSLWINWLSWWAGDSLGVMVSFPIILILIGKPQQLWRSRAFTVALPMLLTLSVFVTVYVKASQLEQEKELQEFQQISRASLAQIISRLDEQRTWLVAMRGRFESSDKVTRSEFHHFTAEILQRQPMIQALEWIPLIPYSKRTDFEVGQRLEIAGFEIRERTPDGSLLPAGKRNLYFPVTYVEPLAGNEIAMGYDIGSNSSRLEAVQKALKSRTSVTTAPIRLVQAKNQYGILLIKSVRLNDQDGGLVLTVLKMRDFINKSLPESSDKLQIRLYDVDASVLLYDNSTPEQANILLTYPFTFGGRHYQLQTMPTRSYIRQHRGWQSWYVLAVGTFGTGLLGALLLLGTGYTARVEKLVKEKTQALKHTEANLRKILENSPEGVLVTSSSEQVTFYNHQLEILLRLAPLSAGNINLGSILDADKAAVVLKAIRGTDSKGMFNLSDPARVIQWERKKIAGEELHTIFFFRDITREVEVDRMKSEFLATAAHELRTPMSSIYGFVELMLHREFSPARRKEYLNIVYDQVKSLITILNELLDLARIEARAGKDFNFSLQDVLEVARRALQELNPDDEHTIGLDVPDENLPAVQIDPEKIRQVFINVLSNAYKYSPAGGEIVLTATTLSDDFGDWLCFRIKDHGIGMTPDQLSRIFEKFYRAVSNSGIPGTGLGMSLTKEIMELHGGKVEVRSEYGAGTEVALYFPLSSRQTSI